MQYNLTNVIYKIRLIDFVTIYYYFYYVKMKIKNYVLNYSYVDLKVGTFYF